MADLSDTVGDLIHRAYNALTGDSTVSKPNKPAYTKIDASAGLGGASGAAATKVAFRERQVDKAVEDSGG